MSEWDPESAPSSRSLPPESVLPPRTVRHVMALGGARAGAGTSTLAVNLAVYLAQLGRKVILVDADPAGGELHTLLGVELDLGRMQSDDDPDEEVRTIATPVPGLELLPQLYTTGSTVPVRPGRKPRWARKLRQLDVDHVLFDLGAGTQPATLDLFLAADLGLCVVAPEPPSVEATYRFARALFQRRVRRTFLRDRFKMRMVERAQAELPPLPTPQSLVRTLARYDTQMGETAAAELSKIQPRLIVNQVQLRTDADLGPAMRDMAQRYLGMTFDYVSHVEKDDAVWLSVVRRRPLLIDGPTSKSARNIERIARRVQALVAAHEHEREGPAVSLVEQEPTLYDVLLTHRGATDEELRRAYRRQRDIYKSDSLPLTSLLVESELVRERARIDEAHDTLLDPLKRRAYDVSTFPEQEEDHEPSNRQLDAAAEAERAMLREELAHQLNPETVFTGALIRKVRESQGVEIADIAARTKISMTYLTALEEEQFDALPAFVYLRGFVQEVAKYLRLDPTQVSRTYLKRYRAWRRQRETSDA